MLGVKSFLCAAITSCLILLSELLLQLQILHDASLIGCSRYVLHSQSGHITSLNLYILSPSQ